MNRFLPSVFRSSETAPMRLDEFSREIHDSCLSLLDCEFVPSLYPYNLTIGHQRRFLWFRVAKVGTRSILKHFHEQAVTLDVKDAMWIHYPVNMFRDYFKFAFVRHPWDRLVSCWRNKVIEDNYFQLDAATRKRLLDFGNFVGWVEQQDLYRYDHHVCLQSRLIDLTHVDFLGRLETFEKDFARVCEKIGVPTDALPKLNRTSPDPEGDRDLYRRYGARVYQLYERDFQIFGYSL